MDCYVKNKLIIILNKKFLLINNQKKIKYLHFLIIKILKIAQIKRFILTIMNKKVINKNKLIIFNNK